jgi:hypothetical protein
MMLFDPEVGVSIRAENVAGRQGRGRRESKECCSETKKNWSWGVLPGDQRRVTLPQRLEWLMK